MSDRDEDEAPELDYRFSLANERTFLAWIRTALALFVCGVAAAKAIEFEHELWRWVVAAPAIVGGVVLSADAIFRWRAYEQAMRIGRRLPAGRGLAVLSIAMATYGVVVLFAVLLDT